MTPPRAPNEPNANAAQIAAEAAGDGVAIRPAERRDLPALGQLGAELVAVHYAFDPQRFFAPKPGTANGYARFLGSQLDEPDAVVLVAEATGDGDGDGDGDG